MLILKYVNLTEPPPITHPHAMWEM